MNELELLNDANERAQSYIKSIGTRRVFPDAISLAGLGAFDGPFPERGLAGAEVLHLLDEKGSPATVASNDPRYLVSS
jgi:hypothetical protein